MRPKTIKCLIKTYKLIPVFFANNTYVYVDYGHLLLFYGLIGQLNQIFIGKVFNRNKVYIIAKAAMPEEQEEKEVKSKKKKKK